MIRKLLSGGRVRISFGSNRRTLPIMRSIEFLYVQDALNDDGSMRQRGGRAADAAQAVHLLFVSRMHCDQLVLKDLIPMRERYVDDCLEVRFLAVAVYMFH